MLKTCTFTLMHFAIAFGVAFALTGSFVVGGMIAIVEPLCNAFGYAIHERVWERVRANRHGRAVNIR